MAVNGGIHSSHQISITLGTIFCVLAIGHFALMWWLKTWMTVFIIAGCILEVTGYLSTAAGYGTQSVQVIVAPIFLSTSVYMSLGTLIKRMDVKDFIPFRTASFCFVLGNVISLGLQIAGVVLGKVQEDKSLGTSITIAGFAVQLLQDLAFFTTTIVVHKKFLKSPFFESGKGVYGWKNYLMTLYILTSLFFVRNCFRIVQFGIGWNGYVARQAAFAYTLDGLLMVIAMTMILFIHPGLVYSRLKADPLLEHTSNEL